MKVAEYTSISRKLLSASVLRVANLFAAAMTSFVLMPFLVHHLGDRTYGFWSLATSFIGYYNLLDVGLSIAVSQHMSAAIGRKDVTECRAVFNTALRVQTVLGGIALLITAVIAVVTPSMGRAHSDVQLFRNVILILGTTTALGFPARVYGGVLEAELRFDIRAWLGLLVLALRTGLSVLAVLSGHGLLALAWAMVIPSISDMVLQAWVARRTVPWARIDNVSIDPTRTKNIMSYSAYTTIAYIADILRFQIDPLVITGFIGLAAVTHHRVASALAQYHLQMVIMSVGMLWPVLSRLHGAGDQSRVEEVFFSGTKLSCCLSGFICIALIGWGKMFIARWMGPRYEDGYLPLVALSIAVFLDVGQKPSIDILYATFKNRVYMCINWVEGIVNLAFSLALARPFGILGVALGTLIGAFVVRIALQPWWVCKVTGFHYAGYMRFFGKNLLRCTCLAGLAVATAAWGLRPSYLWLVSSAIFATGVYAAGAWLVVFNQRERELILGALRKKSGRKRSELAPVAAAIQ